ncbi:uncharacterized protein LOC131942802 [Physella acuta]|uniref:uncharacterized protein LOC131942802 n=1 Tax=Physella acuta TaxID=109671 RepID=UPI0027DB4F90|nr:uncharacterized protein LOC131942802 [Physella acuta]
MTSTTGEDVVIINELVNSKSKNPSMIAKINFFFIVLSETIYWYCFTIKLELKPFGNIYSNQALIPFLGNNIALTMMSLHIFNNRFKRSKLTAVIAAWVGVITSTYWLISVNFLSTETKQTEGSLRTRVRYTLSSVHRRVVDDC